MNQEHAAQPRKVESAKDFHEIAKATLEAVSTNDSGALGGEIIGNIQTSTGYEPEAVAAVFQELADQGTIERSLSDPKAGVVLTEQGQYLFKNYDELVGLNE